MKTLTTWVLAVGLMAATPLIAQETSPPKGEKQIVIIQRTVEPDGTERIETIVKKGDAAKGFDVEQYRREQGADSVRVRVEVIEDPLSRVSRELSEIDWEAIGHDLEKGLQDVCLELEKVLDPDTGEVGRILRRHAPPQPRTQGYLGVSPREGDDPDIQGVPINILPHTAAERAGLQDGDVLLSIDDVPLHNWEELERFIKQSKPGREVMLRYQRDKKEYHARVALGSKLVREPRGRALVEAVPQMEVNFRSKEACLGVYSATCEEQGSSQTIRGARISSFPERSAAREAGLQPGDIITAINTITVKSHDELWDAIARYRPGDKVMVYYRRDGKPGQVEVALKACRDQLAVVAPHRAGSKRPPIALRSPEEGDLPQVPLPEVQEGQRLNLEGFRAYPNPTTGIITVEFRAAAIPTTVMLLDLSGRQLFREELNAFSGQYSQQFDLKEFSKGTLLLVVQQGERLFTERIVLQ